MGKGKIERVSVTKVYILVLNYQIKVNFWNIFLLKSLSKCYFLQPCLAVLFVWNVVKNWWLSSPGASHDRGMSNGGNQSTVTDLQRTLIDCVTYKSGQSFVTQLIDCLPMAAWKGLNCLYYINYWLTLLL